MTRRPLPRRPLTVAGCAAALTVGALAGTATAATASVTHTSRVVNAAADYEVVQIVSWDGYCLTIPVANVGTRLEQVPCGDDHLWWYDPDTEDLYPEGHANVQVGDSGGYLELKAAGTGSPLYYDYEKTGTYDGESCNFVETNFGVSGTYWHANGDGQDVTLDSAYKDDANLWSYVPMDC